LARIVLSVSRATTTPGLRQSTSRRSKISVPMTASSRDSSSSVSTIGDMMGLWKLTNCGLALSSSWET